MKPSPTSAGLLVHLANNYRANDVVKKIHWKYGNNFSHTLSPSSFFGYGTIRDIAVTGQPDLQK